MAGANPCHVSERCVPHNGSTRLRIYGVASNRRPEAEIVPCTGSIELAVPLTFETSDTGGVSDSRLRPVPRLLTDWVVYPCKSSVSVVVLSVNVLMLIRWPVTAPLLAVLVLSTEVTSLAEKNELTSVSPFVPSRMMNAGPPPEPLSTARSLARELNVVGTSVAIALITSFVAILTRPGAPLDPDDPSTPVSAMLTLSVITPLVFVLVDWARAWSVPAASKAQPMTDSIVVFIYLPFVCWVATPPPVSIFLLLFPAALATGRVRENI
jgi:hypothetical protein